MDDRVIWYPGKCFFLYLTPYVFLCSCAIFFFVIFIFFLALSSKSFCCNSWGRYYYFILFLSCLSFFFDFQLRSVIQKTYTSFGSTQIRNAWTFLPFEYIIRMYVWVQFFVCLFKLLFCLVFKYTWNITGSCLDEWRVCSAVAKNPLETPVFGIKFYCDVLFMFFF